MRFLKLFLPATLLFYPGSPTWADFGNRFVADQRLSTELKDSSQKLSYRFTCQEDMTLAAASVFCLTASKPPAYRVSLQKDLNGLPDGNPLVSCSYVPLKNSWTTLPLAATPIFKGKVYHLVVEHDAFRGGGHPVGIIGDSNYASFLSTDVLNHLHPDDGSPDNQANTLFFNKGNWKRLDQEPVYAVFGMGSRFQGNPYDDPGTRPIYGKVLQGQVLHFHCATTAKALTFRVRKEGNPTAPLNYQILVNDYHSHKCTLFYSALAVESSQAPVRFQWVTVGLPPQIQKQFRAECWYFALQTDSGESVDQAHGCKDCYLLSDLGNTGGLPGAADLTFDGGPHLSRATSSLDGGDPFHWIDDFERDANLGTIGPPCPSNPEREFKPVPTPVFLESQPRFEP